MKFKVGLGSEHVLVFSRILVASQQNNGDELLYLDQMLACVIALVTIPVVLEVTDVGCSMSEYFVSSGPQVGN